MPFTINPGRALDLLHEWANEDDQRRLWLSDGGDGAEVSSFDEARECLFTDTMLGRELDSGRTVFGEKIDAMLVKLRGLISKIENERPPEQIIEDSKMDEVRKLAGQLIALITAPSS